MEYVAISPNTFPPYLIQLRRWLPSRFSRSCPVQRPRATPRAGKLHNDMKKDDTLEHSLFAAANTE